MNHPLTFGFVALVLGALVVWSDARGAEIIGAVPAEKTYTIKLTMSEINIIGVAVRTTPMPWNQSNPVLQDIQAQINAQNEQDSTKAKH